MTDNVIHLNIPTRLDISPEKVLKGALENNLQSVVVIGWDKDDKLYGASSMGDVKEILWLVEMIKQQIFEDACD